MNDNEVRPIFRILTLGLSAFAWYVLITSVLSVFKYFNSNVIPFDWSIPLFMLPGGILLLISAIAFTYTTLFGYMPKKLFAILFVKISKNQ